MVKREFRVIRLRYAVGFLIPAAFASYLALSLGGWWHMFHWISASFFLHSFAYARISPTIYGKNERGEIPIWAKIVHMPVMFFFWFVWRLSIRVTNEKPYDKITDDLIIGRKLLEKEIPEGMTNWIDLTSEFEDPEKVRKEFNYICLPILDSDIPSVAQVKNAFSKIRRGYTYIHCAQGHGRTAMVAALFMVAYSRSSSIEEALAKLKAERPAISLNKTQSFFLQKYFD